MRHKKVRVRVARSERPMELATAMARVAMSTVRVRRQSKDVGVITANVKNSSR